LGLLIFKGNVMNDKTKAILEITAPTGQEFSTKGAIVNQTKGLNGVCVEVYIPTKAVEEQQKTRPDTLTMTLIPPNGYVFDDGIEFNADLNSAYITEDYYAKAWIEIKLKPIKKNPVQDQIAQAEADKNAYPLTWTYGWEMTTLLDNSNRWIKVGEVNNDGRRYRRLPNASLIMQCAQDKIDYPEFWHELTQWSNLDEDNWHGVPFDSDTLYEFNKYRQHPHRENIIKFHACSEADKKCWKSCNIDEYGMEITKWYSVEKPSWDDDCKYRLRPRVCFITLQDGTKMEFPEPVRDALKYEQEYFLVNPLSGTVDKFNWSKESIEKGWLVRNFIHLSEEAAKQHLAALQAINAQVVL